MYPTLVRFGPIGIHTFGLMMAAGFLASLVVIRRDYARKGLDPEIASNVIFAAVVGGIIGAKLYYVLFYGDGVSLRGLLSGAGLAWYGGLMGGIAAVLFALWRDQRLANPHGDGIRLGSAVDSVGLALPLGQAFGRIGCFLSGDGDYGPPSDAPWALGFPNGTIPSVVDGETINVHPTMLYDVLLLVAGFLMLRAIRAKFDDKPGALFGLALVTLATERFVTEFWRLTRVFSFQSTPMGWESRSLSDLVHGSAWDGTMIVNGISEFQFWSLMSIAAGVAIVLFARKAASRGQHS